jgi:hypothetical protein
VRGTPIILSLALLAACSGGSGKKDSYDSYPHDVELRAFRPR